MFPWNDVVKVFYEGKEYVASAFWEAIESSTATGNQKAIDGRGRISNNETSSSNLRSSEYLAKNTYGDKTVEEVLTTKKGSIKNAPLPPGGPNWNDLLPLTMEEVRRLAQKGETGYKEIWKLLTDSRFNR